MKSIDLNADVGESFGRWTLGNDAEIMPFISSANVACGGHAGDPNVMAATVRLARSHGVAVGAHPGYPDLPGFGRRVIPFAPEEITRFVLYQIGALWAVAKGEGVELRHVKPHGALYNLAAQDLVTADAVSSAVQAFSTELPLVCLANSVSVESAHSFGIAVIEEGFADRAYEPTGLLRQRKLQGSVLAYPQIVAKQVVALANGVVLAVDGSPVQVAVRTICLHSDTPDAPLFASAVRQALLDAGVAIEPFNRTPGG